MAGAAGFDDSRRLVLGSVYGVRQWGRTDDGRLTGAHSLTWADGENIAECGHPHEVPWSARTDDVRKLEAQRDLLLAEMNALQDEARDKAYEMDRFRVLAEKHRQLSDELSAGALADCACGFWAYWRFDPHEFHLGEKPVVGIIEGYGKMITGTRGFRCGKARIVALHCAYEYVREIPPEDRPVIPQAKERGGWHSVFATDYEQNTPGAIARLAEDETELQANYPSARVYATLDAMLENHPPMKPEL